MQVEGFREKISVSGYSERFYAQPASGAAHDASNSYVDMVKEEKIRVRDPVTGVYDSLDYPNSPLFVGGFRATRTGVGNDNPKAHTAC